MGRSRFVTPGVTRLDLSDGDWIEVKTRLAIAEQKKLESAIIRGAQASPGATLGKGMQNSDLELRLDASMAYMTKLELYLQDWSFKDDRGKHVRVSRSAIANLDPDTADEIVEKLNEFLEEQERAKADDPFTERNSALPSA